MFCLHITCFTVFEMTKNVSGGKIYLVVQIKAGGTNWAKPGGAFSVSLIFGGRIICQVSQYGFQQGSNNHFGVLFDITI